MAIGKVKAIRGVVVDVEFPKGELLDIYEALEIDRPSGRLVLEVQQHLGGGMVKTVAMDSTDGLQREVAVSGFEPEALIIEDLQRAARRLRGAGDRTGRGPRRWRAAGWRGQGARGGVGSSAKSPVD